MELYIFIIVILYISLRKSIYDLIKKFLIATTIDTLRVCTSLYSAYKQKLLITILMTYFLSKKEKIIMMLLKVLDVGYVEKYANNTMKINYYHQGKIYSVVFPINRKPSSAREIYTIKDDKQIDITDHIKSIAGCEKNFHGIQITPRILNLDKVVVKKLELLKTVSCEYEEDDVISII